MKRYSPVAMVFHWLTAAALVFQLALAWRMGGPDDPLKFAVIQLHKSVGITILALTVLRLAWRLTHKPPALPDSLAGWEKGLARATHIAFYALLIILPLTGWLSVSTSPLHIPTRLYGMIPLPHLPAPARWWKPAGNAHMLLAFTLIGLIALHVAGALKHQLFPHEEAVLGRMAPGARHGWKEPRLWTIAAAVATVFAIGSLVKPPLPATAAGAVKAATQMAAPSLAGANWKIDPGSRLTFTTAWSGQPITGRFDRWNAAIAFDPARVGEARIRVVIDIALVNTGDVQRDATLKGADWLKLAVQPVATFDADRVERAGEDRYVAHGVLAIGGVKQPLDLPFTLNLGANQAKAQAEISLDRHAFAIGRGQADSQIPGQVKVQIDLGAERREP